MRRRSRLDSPAKPSVRSECKVVVEVQAKVHPPSELPKRSASRSSQRAHCVRSNLMVSGELAKVGQSLQPDRKRQVVGFVVGFLGRRGKFLGLFCLCSNERAGGVLYSLSLRN